MNPSEIVDRWRAQSAARADQYNSLVRRLAAGGALPQGDADALAEAAIWRCAVSRVKADVEALIRAAALRAGLTDASQCEAAGRELRRLASEHPHLSGAIDAPVDVNSSTMEIHQ